MRKRYSTDLSDKQWKLLEPIIPPAKEGGRPRTTNMRETLNAALYPTTSSPEQYDSTAYR